MISFNRMEAAASCPICKRTLGDKNISKHHLIPKSRGGKGTKQIVIHNICHQKIHATFTEKELKLEFNTIEKLLSHESMAKFIKWVAKKDPAFYQRNHTAKTKLKSRHQKW